MSCVNGFHGRDEGALHSLQLLVQCFQECRRKCPDCRVPPGSNVLLFLCQDREDVSEEPVSERASNLEMPVQVCECISPGILPLAEVMGGADFCHAQLEDPSLAAIYHRLFQSSRVAEKHSITVELFDQLWGFVDVRDKQ